MALQNFSFTTSRGSVRLSFGEEVAVEALGRYFTLAISAPRSIAVSDELLLFVTDTDGDNFSAYTLGGEFAFGLSQLGVKETLLGGSVMSAAEAIRFLSRYPDTKAAADHSYYLATTATYKMLLLDLTAREVVYGG